MILSYTDILGDGKRHRIKATITSEHTQSSYGQPVIVMPGGRLLDLTSWALMGYQVVKANRSEFDLLRKYIGMLALIDSKGAASEFGRMGGSVKSEAKTRAARENSIKPPRPGSKPRGRPHKQ